MACGHVLTRIVAGGGILLGEFIGPSPRTTADVSLQAIAVTPSPDQPAEVYGPSPYGE
jgi:hypothetical protein